MEFHEVVTLHELATDMKWVKAAIETNALSNSADHKTILARMDSSNATLSSHENRIDNSEKYGRANRKIMFGVLSIVGAAVSAMIYAVLRHIGIPINQ